MSRTDHDVKVLNDLIETTIDSANGYEEAAKDAENTRFAGTFASRAQERSQVTSQLQRQVRMLGAEPEDDGSVLAKAHRIASSEVTNVIYLAFMAPDLVQRIVEGDHPQWLGTKRLLAMAPLPLDWREQRRALGMDAPLTV